MFRMKSDPPTAFTAARTAWEAVRSQRKALLARIEGGHAALALAENPPGDGDFRAPRVAQAAELFLAGRVLSARQIRREIEALEDLVDDGKGVYVRAQEVWQAACSAETARLARELQPQHKAAVAKIARAVEGLSLAIAEEAEVHQAFTTAGVGHYSGLPMAGASLGVGTLGEYNSRLADWTRQMRQAGVLE